MEQDVHSYQPIYEQVLDLGQSLHQLSHPRAEPVLFGQLQQLEQKWKGIKGKMSTRSEALASSLLEVHGLQDMMDELGDWVTGAEGDMAIAEGTPIGDDLESVEQQLNQHEVCDRQTDRQMDRQTDRSTDTRCIIRISDFNSSTAVVISRRYGNSPAKNGGS